METKDSETTELVEVKTYQVRCKKCGNKKEVRRGNRIVCSNCGNEIWELDV